ncbi:MAG: decaprenyl-phosphate phosphoribosyltransferase [Candidatus Omnitrophica bacterium]|nr:decaprenyl-phosphate phosphoribosyltransferase [Candidatus Omnitrophota bacterium]
MKKIKYLFFALRPKQWIKNFFIFLPLIFGKKLFVYPTNLKTIIAFFLFSITSSVVYLINDIIDIEKDKFHPTKRLRPIASGKLMTREAWAVAAILGAMSIAFSFQLNIYFGMIIITYLALNVLYSKLLKDVVIIDVFCIGVFFLLRIIAGSIVANVQMSHWIIFTTVLLALFLGFNKRRQELSMLGKKATYHRHTLMQYNSYFIDQMVFVITSSIVVCYMLYTVDPATIARFGTSHLMYSIPFVYYGIFRYLYLIHKLKKEGDPTRILIADKVMQLNLAIWFLVCIAVIYFGA